MNNNLDKLEKRIAEQRSKLKDYQRLIKKQKKSLITAVEKIKSQKYEIQLLKEENEKLNEMLSGVKYE